MQCMNNTKESYHWVPATVSVDCKRLSMFPLKISFSFWLGWNLMHLDYSLGSDTSCQIVTSGGTASADPLSLCEKFNMATSTGKQLVCVRASEQRWHAQGGVTDYSPLPTILPILLPHWASCELVKTSRRNMRDYKHNPQGVQSVQGGSAYQPTISWLISNQWFVSSFLATDLATLQPT